jgi:hypothetical protein
LTFNPLSLQTGCIDPSENLIFILTDSHAFRDCTDPYRHRAFVIPPRLNPCLHVLSSLSVSSQLTTLKVEHTMLIKDPRPPEFPPPVIYHQHLSVRIQVEMPIGVSGTYTSHLGLEHELDDSSSGRIDDVLLSTLSSSSTLVEELSSARPHTRNRKAYFGTF